MDQKRKSLTIPAWTMVPVILLGIALGVWLIVYFPNGVSSAHTLENTDPDPALDRGFGFMRRGGREGVTAMPGRVYQLRAARIRGQVTFMRGQWNASLNLSAGSLVDDADRAVLRHGADMLSRRLDSAAYNFTEQQRTQARAILNQAVAVGSPDQLGRLCQLVEQFEKASNGQTDTSDINAQVVALLTEIDKSVNVESVRAEYKSRAQRIRELLTDAQKQQAGIK
jgi:hypothetical protein